MHYVKQSIYLPLNNLYYVCFSFHLFLEYVHYKYRAKVF